jgi:hypothetical protein
METRELSEAFKDNLYQLLTQHYEDVARHYSDAAHFFNLSAVVWSSPSELIFEAPEVDRAYLFRREVDTWDCREVWLAETAELAAINEKNGGTYLFDVEAHSHRQGLLRVYAAPL